jgi:dTMP kinase
MPGLLVVLEGIDGGGKTTLLRGLAEALRARGREVVETREPTGGPLGRRIRELAAKSRAEISAEEEFQLFHQDRRQHVQDVVRPALERGALVLQDRSYFSSMAYQGERGVDRGRILVESRAIAPEPDLLLVIDVPAEVALERIRLSRGGGTDDFERLESLRRIRSFFVGLEGKTLIDGTRTPEQMRDQALRAILQIVDRRAS